MNVVARLDRVTKRFGRSVALDDASFAIQEGGVVVLLGENGAGKSTALSVLLGLRRPDLGSARLLGRDPRLPVARRGVGVTPQEIAYPVTLRVSEVIRLVAAHFRAPTPTAALVERFGLEPFLHRQTGGLSGGQRRRLAVALAFVGDPRLLVLDEPTAGLDHDSRLAVWQAIREHADRGRTVLLTTHQSGEADALADRMLLIESGRIAADGPVGAFTATTGLTCVRFRGGARTVEGEDTANDGAFRKVYTSDASSVVRRLVDDGEEFTDLEVRPLSLEEALAIRRRKR